MSNGYNSNFRVPGIISINDLLTWHENRQLIARPLYQRYKVWNDSARSFLIDSIVRDYPLPAIFVREKIDVSTRKTEREILDGQQRISAILDFCNDKFTVKKTHNKEIGNKFFSELSDEIKEDILQYRISIEKILISDDSTIFEIFARLNSNNIPLNSQETRNAIFTGEFKTMSYELALKSRELFIRYKIFSNRLISRMADVEFVSILLIELDQGYINQTKTTIDKYYRENELSYQYGEIAYDVFLSTIFIISKIFNKIDNNRSFYFTKNYFYDLFSVIRILYRDIDFDDYAISQVAQLLTEIDYKLDNVRRLKDNIPEEDTKYYQYFEDHRTHSTNSSVKEQRVIFLLNEITSLW